MKFEDYLLFLTSSSGSKFFFKNRKFKSSSFPVLIEAIFMLLNFALFFFPVRAEILNILKTSSVFSFVLLCFYLFFFCLLFF